MKFKFKNEVQQPIVIAALLIVMLVSLWFVLAYLPQPSEKETVKSPQGLEDVRSGTQELSVQILPQSEPDTFEEESGQDGTMAPEEIPVYSETGATEPGKVMPAGDNLKFRIEFFQKLATQPLKFQLFDTSGNEISPDYLKTLQGEKVHFYLIHANFEEFHHMYPEYRNGVWNVSVYMPTPGTYYAYVIANPVEKDPVIYKKDLIVRAESPADIKKPDPTLDLEFNDGIRTATMNMQNLENSRLFTFQILKDGNPETLEPFIETFGQLSIFKQDNPDIFITTTANRNGDVLNFTTEKLTPGRYTAFAEFKIAGNVYVFPITFDIGTL